MLEAVENALLASKRISPTGNKYSGVEMTFHSVVRKNFPSIG